MAKSQQPLPSTLYDESYFLTACEGYQEFTESEGMALSRRLTAAFQIAEVQAGMSVLDVASGRGEIVRHCASMGAHAYGVDYAPAANALALSLLQEAADGSELAGKTGIAQSDAKSLPFPDQFFDRVLMFDIVEHLHPWELDQALREARRVLKDDGRLIIHTAPNRWYDRYAYPLVRTMRIWLGEGNDYPRNPRAITPVNLHVHVNEQDLLSMRRYLRRNGFQSKIWLDSPPQNRREGPILDTLRTLAFGVPPFRWFFERELFAVAWKQR